MTAAGPGHHLVRRARRLRTRKARLEEGAFLAEGLRVVLTAIERSAPIEALLHCPDLLASTRARAAVADANARGVPCLAVTPAAFASLSTRDNPMGLAAVVRTTSPSLDDLSVEPTALYVALDDAADPGNVGTVLRTLDAAGANGLILAGPGTDPFHPTAVKASLGSLWTVPFALAPDMAAVLPWARARGLWTMATSAHAAASFWEVAYPRPLLLLLGSERRGLAGEVLAGAADRVTIPMWGSVSSLNLAVATALLVYQAQRARRGT